MDWMNRKVEISARIWQWTLWYLFLGVIGVTIGQAF